MVANGYKISKGKKPWGDSYFTSKYGLGIADGVGGWTAYGIDPSAFSRSLMNQCKYIIKNKETENTDRGQLAVFENQQSQECVGENISNSQGDKFLRMESAFGTPMRQKKMKRVRSSFHLDEKWLKESKNKNIKLDPQKLIQKAYKEVSDYGSSTAWVWTLDGRNLKIANIGDSTLVIIRFFPDQKSWKILLKTEEQQHNFNAPFQLANIPSNLRSMRENAGNHSTKRKFWKDKVSDSVLYQTNVREGDILIAGTDGLFDNLYAKEIVNIVEIFMSECLTGSSEGSLQSIPTDGNSQGFTKRQIKLMTRKNAKKLAQELVKEAYRKSKSRTCFTPFADKFDKTGVQKDKEFLKWKGGKPDDIWAVVGFIKISEILQL
jgi:serine/threonine protein phosphatase PrpC